MRKIKELEKEIYCLKKGMAELSKQDEIFNPLDLLKTKCRINSYEKEGMIYYYLKTSTTDFLKYFYYNADSKEVDDIISPDFDSKASLYIWIFDNYKKINKKEEEKDK